MQLARQVFIPKHLLLTSEEGIEKDAKLASECHVFFGSPVILVSPNVLVLTTNTICVLASNI